MWPFQYSEDSVLDGLPHEIIEWSESGICRWDWRGFYVYRFTQKFDLWFGGFIQAEHHSSVYCCLRWQFYKT
jgi:hypothetical protein